nr:hypothetical protein [Pantoea sp. 18069]
MQHRRIGAGLDHRRHLLFLGQKALGPGARFGIAVPVETIGQIHALGGFEAQAVDVGDVDQRCGNDLLGGDAEAGHLFDKVGGVASSIGHADHIGLGGLCLHDLGCKFNRPQRVLGRANHLAAGRLHRVFEARAQRLAARVIGLDEKPVLVTCLGDGACCALPLGVFVVGPMQGSGHAVFIGDAQRCLAGGNHHLVLLGRQIHGAIPHRAAQAAGNPFP